LRAFVRSLDGTAQQELNQSPLAFVERVAQDGAETALARKDAIIRVRNAQVCVRACGCPPLLRSAACLQHPDSRLDRLPCSRC
jgi:hypothetical protein